MQVAFVLDAGTSMAGAKFRVAQAALCSTLERLNDDAGILIIVADGDGVASWPDGLTPKSRLNRSVMLRTLNGHRPHGQVRLAPILRNLMAREVDRIVLMSAGDFADARMATVASKDGPPIWANGMFCDTDAAKQVLHELVVASKGRFFDGKLRTGTDVLLKPRSAPSGTKVTARP